MRPLILKLPKLSVREIPLANSLSNQWYLILYSDNQIQRLITKKT